MKRQTRRTVSIALAIIALAALWELAAMLVGKAFLPPPRLALLRLVSRIGDGSLALHLLASARRVALALALAAPLGIILGLAAGRSRRFDVLVSPFVYLLHPLPKIAFLPILMLFLGLGDPAKVVLIFLIIFGQILVSARDAAKSVPQPMLDTLKAMGAGRISLLRHVILPFAAPALLSALRISLGTAVAVLFMAESFASETGLGWYVVDAWTRVDYPDMYAAIITLSVFGLACYLAVDLAEALLCRWRDSD